MGGLTSIVSGINEIASVVGTVNSLANNVNSLTGSGNSQALKDQKKQQALALAQLKGQQAEAQQTAAAQAALAKQQLQAQAQSAEDDRLQSLRRAVARQRAAYGAQGVDSGDGSSQAVLLGMFDESDQDKQNRAQLDTLRSAAIDQNLAAQTGADVLQLSQLQQRQRLDRELLAEQ
jgi:hypothetical protein